MAYETSQTIHDKIVAMATGLGISVNEALQLFKADVDGKISLINTAVATNTQGVADNATAIAANAVEIQKIIEVSDNGVESLMEKILANKARIAEIVAVLAEADSDVLENILSRIKANESAITAVSDKLAADKLELQGNIDTVSGDLADYKTATDAAQATQDGKITTNTNDIAALTQTVSDNKTSNCSCWW